MFAGTYNKLSHEGKQYAPPPMWRYEAPEPNTASSEMPNGTPWHVTEVEPKRTSHYGDDAFDSRPSMSRHSSNARSFVSTSQSGTRGFPSPEPSPTMPTPYTGSSYEHSHGANNRPYTHEHSSTPRPKPTVCIPAPSHERGLGSEGFGTPQSQPSSVYFTPMDRSAQSASASGLPYQYPPGNHSFPVPTTTGPSMPSGDHSAIHFPDVGGANVSRHPSTTTEPCSTLVDSDSSSFVPRPNSTYDGLPPSSVGCATPKPTPPLELAPAGAGKTSKRPWRRTSKPCDGQRPKGEKDKPIAPKPKPKPQRPRGQAARPAAQNGKDGKKDGKSCVIM